MLRSQVRRDSLHADIVFQKPKETDSPSGGQAFFLLACFEAHIQYFGLAPSFWREAQQLPKTKRKRKKAE
jgi:hypothetical protein